MTKSGEQQLNEHKNGGCCYANLGFSAKIPYRSPKPISHQVRHDRGHANMIRGLCNKRPKAANSLLATLNLCILFKPPLQPLKSQQIKGKAGSEIHDNLRRLKCQRAGTICGEAYGGWAYSVAPRVSSRLQHRFHFSATFLEYFVGYYYPKDITGIAASGKSEKEREQRNKCSVKNLAMPNEMLIGFLINTYFLLSYI